MTIKLYDMMSSTTVSYPKDGSIKKLNDMISPIIISGEKANSIKKLNDMIPERANTGSGLGYTAANLGLGIAGIFEGVSDLLSANAALLSGDKAYAEYVYKKSVVGEWKKSLDDAYNPSGFMSFVGDVAQGVGQSSVFLLDALGVPVGTTTFFAGAIGNSTAEAVQTTGEYGIKEAVYGTLSGGAEGALELVSGAGGKLVGNIAGKVGNTAVGKAVSALTGQVAKDAVWKGLVKGMISDGAGEFVEEFLGDYVDVALKRITGVDKTASTTFKQAVYSGLVGFASGAAMGGVSTGVGYTAAYNSGKKVAAEGNADVLIKSATAVADSVKTNNAKAKNIGEEYSMLKTALAGYNSIADKTSGDAMVRLGEVQRYMTYLEIAPQVRALSDIALEHSDEYALYMSNLTGRNYTTTDFKTDKDGVRTKLAAMMYAGRFLKDSAAEAEMQRFTDIINADVAGKSVGQRTVQDIKTAPAWNGESAVYAVGDEYIKVTPSDAVQSERTDFTGTDDADSNTADGTNEPTYSVAWGKNASDMKGFKGKTREEAAEIIEKIKSAAGDIETAEAEKVKATLTAQAKALEAFTPAPGASTGKVRMLKKRQQSAERRAQAVANSTVNANTGISGETATEKENGSQGKNEARERLDALRLDIRASDNGVETYTAEEQDAARKALKNFDR